MNVLEGQKILLSKCKQGMWYQYGCALPIACFGALALIAILSEKPSATIYSIAMLTCIVSVVLAIAIFVYGITLRKKATLYKMIFPLVVYEKKSSIDEIAACIGVNIPQTLTAVEKMIDNGIFASYYIDTLTRQIIDLEEDTKTTAEQSSNPKEIICKGCGASISATAKVCEFCGATIAENTDDK